MLESTEYFETTSEGALIWEAQESDVWSRIRRSQEKGESEGEPDFFRKKDMEKGQEWESVVYLMQCFSSSKDLGTSQ